MVDQMVQVDFINDIEALQLAQSERIFTKAANLFLKKWSSREPNFIEYFSSEGLPSHNERYEGV
jgi:hypothetical protein